LDQNHRVDRRGILLGWRRAAFVQHGNHGHMRAYDCHDYCLEAKALNQT